MKIIDPTAKKETVETTYDDVTGKPSLKKNITSSSPVSDKCPKYMGRY
jgi:hypothetical protein